MKPRSSNREKGLTLVELLLAISITSFIIITVYSSVSRLSASKKYLDEERESFLIANSILKRMTRELQMIDSSRDLLQPQNNIDFYEDSNDDKKLDLAGKAQRISGDRNGDIITFIASEAGQYVPDGRTHAGTVQITYRTATDPEKPDSKSVFLIRDETPLLEPVETAWENTMTFPLTENLQSISFHYYDPEESKWRRDWPEDLLRLPSKIAFRIEILTDSGKVRQYSTMVPVHGGRM